MLISAAETVGRELKSFPSDFVSASHAWDTSALRSKGLYQLPLADLEYLSSRWSDLATTVLNPDDPISLTHQLAEAGRLLKVSTSQPLEPGEKTVLFASANMLDSLESYLAPGGVYRSSWSDPRVEKCMERIDALIETLPNQQTDGITVRVVVPGSSSGLDQARHSIRILRDVVRRVGLVFPSVEMSVEGSLVQAVDRQKSIEQGLSFAALVGLVLSLVGSLLAWRCWQGSLALGGSLLSTVGLLAGYLTLRFGVFDLGSATWLLLAMPIAALAPARWITLSLRGGEEASRLHRSLLGTLVASAACGAAGFLGAEPFASFAEVSAVSLLVSVAVTMSLVAPLLGVLWVSDANHSKTPAATLRRSPRLAAVFGMSLVMLASLGLARWMVPAWKPTGERGSKEMFASSQANSAEEARRLAKSLKELSSVGQVIELASWIPVDQLQKRKVVETLSLLANAWNAQAKPASASATAEFRRSLRLIQVPTELASASDEVLVDRTARLARQVEEKLGRLSSVDQDRRLSAFERLWMEDVGRELNRLGKVSGTEPVTIADLPAPLVGRLYRPDGKWTLLVYPKENRPGSLSTFRSQVLEVDPGAVGPAILFVGTIRSQSHRLLFGIAVTLLVAGVLTLVLSRRGWDLTIVMVPTTGGCLASIGLLGWLGMDWNEETIRALSAAWPLMLAAGITAGWSCLGGRGVRTVSILLPGWMAVCWALPMLLAAEPELIRWGVALLVGGMVTSIIGWLIAPSWRRMVDADETLPAAVEEKLASTVFFREAA
jgi:hypothetical protein